jgi:hypothetical protein
LYSLVVVLLQRSDPDGLLYGGTCLLIGSDHDIRDLSEWYLARARVDEVLHGEYAEGTRRARRGGAAGSRYLLLGESTGHVTILQSVLTLVVITVGHDTHERVQSE